MKNYILALLLIPLLVHGQKFREGEVKLNIEAESEAITPTAVTSMETVPRLLSYQGFLTVGNAGPVSDGQYTINFRLFDQEEGGTEFWSETHLSTISDGLVSALLGSNGQPIQAVPMNSYLEVEIDGNVLSPRQQITSVLYSVISDSTNFAKGYTNTVDLFDTLSYFALRDTLNYFPLSSQLSAVAFSGEYDSLLNLPNLVQYAVTDTLSYYTTLDSLDHYVMDTSLSEYIGTIIQPFDSALTQISDLRYPLFEGGELIVWDGEESKWDALSGIEGGELLVFDGIQSKWVAISGAEARDTLGLEDMSIQRPDSVIISGGTIVGIEDISVEDGGTGASGDSTARVNLGLRIGTDVQAWDQDLQTIGNQVHSANENTKQVLVSHGFYWSAVTADSARTDLGLKIGQDVQAYDQDLQENSRYMIDGDGVNGQFWSSDGIERGQWKTFTEKFEFTDTTLTVKTGTNAGDIVELEIGSKLPAVDGSQLSELNAYQLNDSIVSNEEYNMLAGVRTISGAEGPGGRIQTQLDNKAQMGANSDITSITGLTTMLAVNQGGTGAPNDSIARVNLGLVIGQDVQQQSVHLQDLADDGILDADRVEHGEYFITTPGNNGWQWTSDGTDEGYWAPGGDIAHVYTDADRGLIINGGSVAEAGSVYINIDAGSAVNQIPRLEYSSNWVGGALPEADASSLLFLKAHQINANVADASDFPVSDDQFNLLSNLRETAHPTNARLSFGQVQDQLDEKQKRSNVLDDIDTSSANVSSNDLLIFKDNASGWELLTEEEGEVTASRVEFGDYFINGAGINGQFWSSDGSENGLWRTLDAHFIIGDSTLAIRTGTNAGDIVELEIGSKLPAVDGSQLLELNAYQLNDSTVSNDEFNQLANLRVVSDPSTDTASTHFTFGNIQEDQLDNKQNWNRYLDDLADGELTATAVEYHQFFITEPGSTGKVWTWEPSLSNPYGGFGFWKLPPGAQSLGQLTDASTDGDDNVFIGNLSGQDITTGTANSALGEEALNNLTTGDINIAIGARAGSAITTGSGNILIGYQAGSDLSPSTSNKLIIDNGNPDIVEPRPLIEGSFLSGPDRGLNLDGTMLINGDLYTVNDFFISTVDGNNDVASSQFSIVENLGDVTITNKTADKKIKFVVDDGVGVESELLVLNGGNNRVEVTGTTKLAIGDESETYIGATLSGTQLNLKGAERVLVGGSTYAGSAVQLKADSVYLTSDVVYIDGDAKTTGLAEFDGAVQVDNTITVGVNDTGHDVTFFGATAGKQMKWVQATDELVMAGDTKLSFHDAAGGENITASGNGFLDIRAGTTVDITATDTVKIEAQNIVIDPGTEMIVDSDFKARGKLTVVDGNDSLIIHGTSAEGITMQNGTTDSDIIFELESGEVMRLEKVSATTYEALRVLGENLIRFGDDDVNIQNQSNALTLRNKLDGGDIVFKVDDADDEILTLNGDADGAHLVDISTATKIAGNLTLGDALILGTTVDETSRISRVSGNLTITNEEQNKDIVFIGNKTGVPTEILRLVTEENITRVLNILEVNNTVNDANGTKLDLKKLRSGPPIDNDELAVISAAGKNSVLDEEEYAKIRMTAREVADASEKGTIEFWVRNAGASTYKMMDMNTTVDSTVTVTGHMDVKGKLSADYWVFRSAIFPEEAGESTIGTETNEWGDLYLHDDKSIKFGAAQNATITHESSGRLTHDAAEMVFNTNEGGIIKQVMDINVETDNVITVGTSTNLTGLKVYGTLTISETAFEKDLIPAEDGGGVHEAGLGSSAPLARRWKDLHLFDNAIASFGGKNIPAVTLTHDDGTGDANPGLILDTDSKFYFDDVNTFIGIRTDDSGILEVESNNEVEIDGGLLLDLDGDAVTIDATAAAANIALTTNSGKVTLETGTAGTLSHSSDGPDEDFTIEQINTGGAHDASLFINSAGTGGDAIAVTASAGGIDIKAFAVMDITTSAGNSNINVDPHGTGTLVLGSADNDSVTVDAKALGLTSATGNIRIEQDGGSAHKILLRAEGSGLDGSDALHLLSTTNGIKLQADNGALTSTSNSFSFTADAANSFLTQDLANGVLTVRSINTVSDGTQRLDLISDGTGINAIDIATANGGIKITPKADGKTENVGAFQVSSPTNDAAAVLRLSADDGASRDNKDRWKIIAENENAGSGGEIKIESLESNSWVTKMTLTNGGVLSAGSFDGGITSTLISSGEDEDDALVLETTAGGMDIEVTGQEHLEDLDITTFGSTTEMRLKSESDQLDAIDLITTAGGVDIDAKTKLALDGEGGIDIGLEDRVAVGINAAGLTVNANAASSIVTSSGALTLTGAGASTWSTGAGLLTLQGAGGVTATSTGGTMTLNGTGQTVVLNGATIDIDGENSTLTITNTADGTGTDNFTIEQKGAHAASLILSSAGTGNDALTITTTAGGIDITAGGNGALDDLDITATGTATEIRVTSASEQNDAIDLKATAGGILARVADTKTLVLGNNPASTADTYVKVAPSSVTGDEKIEILNTAGTAAEAISLTAVAGGILGRVADGKDLVLGDINGASSDSYFKLSASATPANVKIEIKNAAGDGQVDAIKLHAVDGGITIDAGSGDAATDDVVIVGKNFSVTAAGVMGVEGAITADSFSGTMVTSSLSPAINEALTISTTTDNGDANDHITFNSVDNVAINSEQDIILDSGSDIVLDAAGNNITMKVAGTDRLDITTENTGDVVIQSMTDNYDMVFKNDDTEVLRIDDDGSAAFNAALNVTGLSTLTAGITVGTDGSGADVTFHSGTSGDKFLWDYNNEVLKIWGTNAQTALDVLDGDVVVADKLYLFDRGGEYLSSNGSALTLTGNTLVVGTLGASAAVDLATASGITTIGASTALTVGTDGVLTVNNTTDASSSTTGSTIIDGGVGIAMKLYVGTNLDVTGTTLLAGETTVNTGIIPDADGAYIGAAAKPFGNVFVGDGSVLNFGDNQDVQLTHYHDNGLLLNSTNKIYFEDGSSYDQYIGSKTATGGITIVNAPATIELVAPSLIIDASTAVAIDAPSVKLETVALQLNEPAAAGSPGRIEFFEKTTNDGNDTYISIEAGDVNTDTDIAIQLVLPIEVPTAGQVLKSGGILGSGKNELYWAADNSTAAGAENDNIIGTGVGDNYVELKFEGTGENDGIIKWWDGDGTGYFTINKQTRMVGTTQLQFNDTGTYIHSSENAQLDLVSDGAISITGTAGLVKLTSGGDMEIESKTTMKLSIDANSTPGNDDIFAFYAQGSEKARLDEVGALQIDGNITIDGNTATFGNGATIVNTSADLLTITEATTALSGALTLGTDLAVEHGGTGASTLTDGGVLLGSGTSAITATAVLGNGELLIGDNSTDPTVATLTGTSNQITVTNGAGSITLSTPQDIHTGASPQFAEIELSHGSANTLTASSGDLSIEGNVLYRAGGTDMTVADGGTGAGTFTDGGILFGNGTGAIQASAVLAAGEILIGDGSTEPTILDVGSASAITVLGTVATGVWEGTDVAVAHGGTGVSTLADGGLVIGNAASAVEVVAAGATTEILVGGGASTAPVWTTATGTGAPVRAVSPTFTTPDLGTPTALVGTSITGTASGFTAGNVTTNANLTGDVTSVGNATTIAAGSVDAAHLNATGAEDDYILTYDDAGGGFVWKNHTDAAAHASDRRYKKNITTVTSALEKLSKLNPVNYDWRIDEFPHKGFKDVKQWGFIAQELENVMPELVKEDKNGYLSLNYTGVIPLLTKAMQEQQTEMEKQQKEIDQLKAQLQSIMKMLDNDMSDKTDDKKADDNKKPVKLSMATVK